MAEKPLFDFSEEELKEAVRMKQNFISYNVTDYQRELDRRTDRHRTNRSFLISLLSTATAIIALIISLIKGCSSPSDVTQTAKQNHPPPRAVSDSVPTRH